MRNIRITLQYEGTRYKGWQRQKSTDQTIQGKIERILERQFGRNIEIDGSGRTDAGVHARCQIANFRLKESELEVVHQNMDELRDLLNAYLPEDIAVITAAQASDRFHSRLNAVAKTYRYYIWNSSVPDVFRRRYSWQIKEELDVAAMREAAVYLCGQHDFAAFCGNAHMKKSTVRNIYSIDMIEDGPSLELVFTGNGFLQNMVRILTGTLTECGLGKRMPEDIKEILESKDRSRAGLKAPAQGLILWEVKYD